MDIDRRALCLGLFSFGLTNGVLSIDQTGAALEAAAAGDAEFFIARGIDFFDSPIRSIRAADVETLLDARIKLLPEGLELATWGRKAMRRVYTCREYRQAMSEGYFPFSTFDMKEASRFEIPNGILLAAERGRNARVSYFNGVHFDKYLPSVLSAKAAEHFPEPEIPKGISTLQQLVDAGEAGIGFDTGSITIEYDFMGRVLREVLRADLNGDGFEEVLVFDYSYAICGSQGSGHMSILTRTEADGIIDLSPWPPETWKVPESVVS